MIDGNEPAMPVDRDRVNMNCTGLTKREHFAALAMQGLMANGSRNPYNWKDMIADRAVEVADALIIELKKKP
jgi:hypothetical protein